MRLLHDTLFWGYVRDSAVRYAVIILAVYAWYSGSVYAAWPWVALLPIVFYAGYLCGRSCKDGKI